VSAKRRTNSREQLLLVGRKLFSRQGFSGTSTRQIAAEAGCNLALINHYFGSKEGLLVAVLESEMRGEGPRLAAALQGSGTAAEQLAGFIAQAVDHFAEDAEFLRIAHREVIQHGSRLLPKLIPPIERVIGVVAERFRNARKGTPEAELDPRMSALLLVGAMQFYFIAYPLTSKLVGAESPGLRTELKRQISALFVGAPPPGRRRSIRRGSRKEAP
jgi:AcrR family transcriptional regulator